MYLTHLGIAVDNPVFLKMFPLETHQIVANDRPVFRLGWTLTRNLWATVGANLASFLAEGVGFISHYLRRVKCGFSHSWTLSTHCWLDPAQWSTGMSVEANHCRYIQTGSYDRGERTVKHESFNFAY